MVERQQHAPKSIYVLADHLDTALAAVEDLLKLNTECASQNELLRLELVAITHVLQARQRIRELHFDDSRLADQAVLFLAGTAALEIKDLVNAQPRIEPVPITEDYPIGRRIPIGFLADLATAMLDTLEYCYVLYESEGSKAPIIDVWSTSNVRGAHLIQNT
jgi:hypothetical protein